MLGPPSAAAIENRALLPEMTGGILKEWQGQGRGQAIAARQSGCHSDNVPHFNYVIGGFGKRGLAYLRLIEPRAPPSAARPRKSAPVFG